ncbi:ribonuclease H-like domain-containing protein [Aspergillus granulosus]|uniref:ribonuclease H n=1 Tax=Aspergillus granulosus TaxID=176169 RepID=A0ABR4HNP0_9EURO
MQRRYRRRKAPRSSKNGQGPSDVDEMHSSSAHSPSSVFSQERCSSVSSPPRSLPEADLAPGRRFHPDNEYPKRFSQEDIEVPREESVYLACPGSKRKCPQCKVHVAHSDCLVIAIDGACSNNGKDKARSSIGVFHGYGSEWNVSCTLDNTGRHTNQIAELEACSRALSNAIAIQAEWDLTDHPLDTLVIKSDSEYVVRGLTEWLPKWKKNGWKNAKGLPVTNSYLFQRIDWLIEQLEQNISVKFWIVPRGQNGMADAMAKYALKEQIRGAGKSYYAV